MATWNFAVDLGIEQEDVFWATTDMSSPASYLQDIQNVVQPTSNIPEKAEQEIDLASFGLHNMEEYQLMVNIKEDWGTEQDFNEILEQVRADKQVKDEVVEDEISWLDVWVKSWKWLSSFWEDIKLWWAKLWEDSIIWGIGKTIGNIPWDFVQAVWEAVELVSDPLWTTKSILDLWQWLSDKLIFNALNSLTWKNVEGSEKSKIVDAVSEDLQRNFWSIDKAIETITNSPVDSMLFVKWIIRSAKKVAWEETLKDLESIEKTIPEKLNESAIKDVEQALWTTKEKFKQKWRELAPEIIDRWITWSKEEIQQMAQSKVSDFWNQINDFIDSGKLKWTVKRDDLLNVLDDVRKQWEVWDVIIDESIVKAADNFSDVISWFGKEIPAEKARIIRQMFDDAVYNTKWIVSEEALSLKNNIKKWLADNIRKQLAEQNPDLDFINKEFAFYKKLDDTLTETLNRQWPQQGWLTWNIAAWGWLWAWSVIFWDISWAVATAVAAKFLSEAMKSTKWKTVSAQTKTKLADALASGNQAESTKLINKISKEVLNKKLEIAVWGQVTESNLELNK